MLIGILSDTHDRYEIMGQAVAALQTRGAGFFIHCGDLCRPNMLDHLAGLDCAVVWGNCDGDRAGLARYGEEIGVRCHGELADLTLDGKNIAVIHGDDRARFNALLEAQRHDYLFCGHSHIRRDELVGRTRIINPGALHRAAEKTAALLDTAGDAVEFIRIA